MYFTMSIIRAHGSMLKSYPPTSREGALAIHLADALDGGMVVDGEPVHGEAYSIRLFLAHKRAGSLHIIQPTSATAISRELLMLADPRGMQPARYAPINNDGMVRGWKVEKIPFNERPAALVCAAWASD